MFRRVTERRAVVRRVVAVGRTAFARARHAAQALRAVLVQARRLLLPIQRGLVCEEGERAVLPLALPPAPVAALDPFTFFEPRHVALDEAVDGCALSFGQGA